MNYNSYSRPNNDFQYPYVKNSNGQYPRNPITGESSQNTRMVNSTSNNKYSNNTNSGYLQQQQQNQNQSLNRNVYQNSNTKISQSNYTYGSKYGISSNNNNINGIHSGEKSFNIRQTKNSGGSMQQYDEDGVRHKQQSSNDYYKQRQQQQQQQQQQLPEGYQKINTSNRQQQQLLLQQQQEEQQRKQQLQLQQKQQQQVYSVGPPPEIKMKSDRGITGLNNIGNTCFMNSSLQCLFNLPGFNEYFLSNQYASELKSRNKGIAKEYAALLNSVRSKRGGSESTYGIKRTIEKVSQQFSGYAQQDAQELLTVVLDGLHEDLNRINSKPKYRELTADQSKRSLQSISDDWFDYYKGRDNSIVYDFFCGQMMNKVICGTCQYESLAFDNFLDLSLSFTKGLQRLQECDLERLLDQYAKEEPLDDEYNCEKCKKQRKSKRQFIFWKMPKILVIHLKRFKFGRTYTGSSKINHSVSFPVTGLNMKQFLQESKDSTVQDCVYDLCGVVNHSGSLYGGHYTADAMNPYDHRWYRFNDSQVHEIDIKSQRYDSVGSSSPYILFYCKRSIIK